MVLTAATTTTGQSTRIHAIDWLRVVAVLVIFFAHVAHIFDFDREAAIKNTQLSLLASVYLFFTLQWAVPLLFLLAGMSAWFSLHTRSSQSFLRERAHRLLIPLLFGSAVLIPWIAYMSALNHASFDGSYWQWFPVHFERTWESLRDPWLHHGPAALYYTSWHLWFLGYLLMFSACFVLCFRRTRFTWFEALSNSRAGLILLGGPIVIVKIALAASFPAYLDWSDTLVYFTLFIYGWLFMADARSLRAVERQAFVWLAIGCISYALILATYAVGYLTQWLAHPSYTADYLLYQSLSALNTWAWVLAVLGCGLRWLNFENAILRYAGEAVLPFYILHQVAIATIGTVVVQWHTGTAMKFAVITAAAFAATLLAYEFLVRRSRPVRVLFGLRAA
jgi:peptidoglycan/LPS O-acetylase OafA/YrhL